MDKTVCQYLSVLTEHTVHHLNISRYTEILVPTEDSVFEFVYPLLYLYIFGTICPLSHVAVFAWLVLAPLHMKGAMVIY